MKYETPELTALTTAINAIQTQEKGIEVVSDDAGSGKEALHGFADWED